MRTAKHKRADGFTLVELLLVLLIISLMMALFMPALRRARVQAKTTVCQAHLHGCIQAAILYGGNHGGRLPPCTEEIFPTTGSYALWVAMLTGNEYEGYLGHGILANKGYISEPEVYYCPANMNKTLQYGEQSPNVLGGGWPRRGTIPDDLPIGQVLVQSTYQYRSLWDGQKFRSVDYDSDGVGIGVMVDVFSDPGRGVDYHHKDGYNVAYADGHTDYVTDKGFLIRDYNAGAEYHTDHRMQDRVWKEFLDETRKFPMP